MSILYDCSQFQFLSGSAGHFDEALESVEKGRGRFKQFFMSFTHQNLLSAYLMGNSNDLS